MHTASMEHEWVDSRAWLRHIHSGYTPALGAQTEHTTHEYQGDLPLILAVALKSTYPSTLSEISRMTLTSNDCMDSSRPSCADSTYQHSLAVYVPIQIYWHCASGLGTRMFIPS